MWFQAKVLKHPMEDHDDCQSQDETADKDEQGADPGFLRDGARLLAQELMDAEVTQRAGAGLHERSENRLT